MKLSSYRSSPPERVQASRPCAAFLPSVRVSRRPGLFPGASVTTDMVALGENLRPPPTLSAAHTPFLATSQLTPDKVFVIPVWRPRSGLDEHHPLWKAGVRRLLATFDLTESELISAVAQCRAILSGARPPIFSDDPDEASAQAALLRPGGRDRAVAGSQHCGVLARTGVRRPAASSYSHNRRIKPPPQPRLVSPVLTSSG